MQVKNIPPDNKMLPCFNEVSHIETGEHFSISELFHYPGCITIPENRNVTTENNYQNVSVLASTSHFLSFSERFNAVPSCRE